MDRWIARLLRKDDRWLSQADGPFQASRSRVDQVARCLSKGASRRASTLERKLHFVSERLPCGIPHAKWITVRTRGCASRFQQRNALRDRPKASERQTSWSTTDPFFFFSPATQISLLRSVLRYSLPFALQRSHASRYLVAVVVVRECLFFPKRYASDRKPVYRKALVFVRGSHGTLDFESVLSVTDADSDAVTLSRIRGTAIRG